MGPARGSADGGSWHWLWPPRPRRCASDLAPPGVLGITGDLSSRCEAEAGVKDSAALIKGTGGVLDRIDGCVLRAVYYHDERYLA